MAQIHNLGFPRIGQNRELKFALEKYWKGNSSESELLDLAESVRNYNWQLQEQLDWLPVGDFSLYDHVLDMSFLLGNLPQRIYAGEECSELDRYFRLARGRANAQEEGVTAGEMTKWFDTNYHYIVPEICAQTEFKLNPTRLINEIKAAQQQGFKAKPVIIGPVTYLWLSKTTDNSQALDQLERLLSVYRELLAELSNSGVEWVQIDEPILVTELAPAWKAALEQAYFSLQQRDVKLLLTSYFGRLKENLEFACKLPTQGLHVDAVNGRDEIIQVVDWLPSFKVLSLGVINGRNVWISDLNAVLETLQPVAERLQERLWLAPSCSLLHVPVNLELETDLDTEIKGWLAFAVQKLEELNVLKTALNEGREAVDEQLQLNAEAIAARRSSARVNNTAVREALAQLSQTDNTQRQNHYEIRARKQRAILQLPLFPTTTIGSFPQTAEIRQTRLRFRRGDLTEALYIEQMQNAIAESVREQEQLDLDVLVHGEAERNDMVEYFGEQLDGFIFTRYGWVQSYGSRCVKPPILFGDIQRPKPMTVDWINYAQSLTDKPVKGMLTGPVTILNWSFVRDDQPRSETCAQLALAIRQEVLDLEKSGCQIIQIDEAALREGLPLRRQEWQHYLDWAVKAFQITANGVNDETQIHTHMCYSEFNDIIEAIAQLDADVITIETSRSNMELLDAFDRFNYPNEIGPGVYDIHSPNIPETAQMVDLLSQAARRIPAERLWVNPDCGLKTRQWSEVRPALKNMIVAAQQLRQQIKAA